MSTDNSLERGRAAQDAGDWNAAIAAFTEVIRADPDNANHRLERAEVYRAAGATDEALADFTVALQLRHGYPAALVGRGNLFSELGRVEEAIADFRAALRQEKDHISGVRYNLGNAYYRLDLAEEALAEYDAATRADPTFGWAHHGRAIALAFLGRHSDSLAAAEQACALLPGHPAPLNGRAAALAQLGQHEQALVAFGEVLQLDPRSGTAHRNRAKLHDQMGRPDLAAADRAAQQWCEAKANLRGEKPMRVSAKMKRLYRRFSELCGGEPEDLWVFDPLDFDTPPPPFLGVTHVMTWLADANCDVTSFQSLGMSDRYIPGTDYFCEVHLAIRAELTDQQRLKVARRIADICAYPFQFDRKLDWWEIIHDPGRLPGFEGCKHLLIHPRLSAESFDQIEDEEGLIKVLWLVPITPAERHILLEHGRQALQDYFVQHKIDVLQDRADPAR